MPKLLVLSGADVVKALERLEASSSVSCRAPADWYNNFSQCLYDWQTLIGGILALFAAAATIYFLRKQIRQAAELAETQLKRQHNATRVALPLALSGLLEFCQKTADEIAQQIETISSGLNVDSELNDAVQPGSENAPPFKRHEIPQDSISLIYKFVETLNNEQEAKHVSELVSQFQVFNARYVGIHVNNIADSDSLYGLLLDCATVKFLTESVFNYARSVDDASFAKVGSISNENAWREIQRSATGLIFHRPIIDDFVEQIRHKVDRYIELNTSPWLERFVA
jgi:hypothetical protein